MILIPLLYLSFNFFGIYLLYFRAFTGFLWKLRVLFSSFAWLLFIINVSLLCLFQFLYILPLIFYFIAISILVLWIYPSIEALNILPKKDKFTFVEIYKYIFSKPKITIENLIYNADNKLFIDFYRNAELEDKVPLIIDIHGGSWQNGDNKEFIYFNKKLASQNISIASITYRLCPENKFPSQIIDSEKALEYLILNADKFKIDLQNIYLLGRSAGGQIAALLSQKLGKTRIKGVICIYSPFDLHWGYQFPANKWVSDSQKILENYLGYTLSENENIYKEASPNYNITKNSPPFLLIHGLKDEVVAHQHNDRLIRALSYHEIEYQYFKFLYSTHGFDYFKLSVESFINIKIIENFILRYSK